MIDPKGTLLDIDLTPPRLTREEMEAFFRPCPICERIVEVEITKGKDGKAGTYESRHDLEKHGLVWHPRGEVC